MGEERVFVQAKGCRRILGAVVGVLLILLMVGVATPAYLVLHYTDDEVELCRGGSSSCGECSETHKSVKLNRMQPGHQFAAVYFAFSAPPRPVSQSRSAVLTVDLVGLNPETQAWEHITSTVFNHSRNFDCEQPSKVVRFDNLEHTAQGLLCPPVQLLELSFLAYEVYDIHYSFQGDGIADFCHFDSSQQVYHVGGQLFLEFTSPAYTTFEVVFKYCLLGITIVVTLAFGYEIRKRKRTRASYEQRWVLYLLVGLIFYNDPLFAIAVYVPSSAAALQTIHVVAATTFVAGLLLFWLLAPARIKENAQRKLETGAVHPPAKVVSASTNSGSRDSASQVVKPPRLEAQIEGYVDTDLRQARINSSQPMGGEQGVAASKSLCKCSLLHSRQHRGKVIFCLVVWVFTIMGEISVLQHRFQDPAFNPLEDVGHLSIYWMLVLVVTVVYFAWLMRLVASNTMLSAYIEGNDAFVLSLNVGVLGVLVLSMILGSVRASTIQTSGFSLVILHGLLSVYVWTLAIGFFPYPSKPNRFDDDAIFGGQSFEMSQLDFAQGPLSPFNSPTRAEDQVVFEYIEESQRTVMTANV